jgi:hypothetical protein
MRKGRFLKSVCLSCNRQEVIFDPNSKADHTDPESRFYALMSGIRPNPPPPPHRPSGKRLLFNIWISPWLCFSVFSQTMWWQPVESWLKHCCQVYFSWDWLLHTSFKDNFSPVKIINSVEWDAIIIKNDEYTTGPICKYWFISHLI